MIPVPKRKADPAFRRQEDRLAKNLGGVKTPGSGSGRFVKADVRVKGLVRVEAKTTKHQSFSVTKELIQKIEMFGVGASEIPALHIEIDNEGSPVSCYVLPVWAVEHLLHMVSCNGLHGEDS
jgi:hypothetical protein